MSRSTGTRPVLQWVAPLLLGLLAATAVYLWDPLAEAPAPPATQPIAVFEAGPVGDAPREVLVVANDTWHGVHAFPWPGSGPVEGDFVGHLGLVEARACPGCPPGPFVLQPPPAGAPRAGEDGLIGVRATFYVFNEEGLLASNAPLYERGRFQLHPDFQTLPNVVWHVGDGPAPEGMEDLPAFAAVARTLVQGEPVGAHMAMRVEDHDHAWAVGPVTVAARIDALVHA